jgi:hypothetical protein
MMVDDEEMIAERNHEIRENFSNISVNVGRDTKQTIR